MIPDRNGLPEPDLTSDGRRPRTLLVEDHLDSAEALRRLLAMHGHDVTVALTFAGAVGAAEGRHFDLLIADMGLPDGDGRDLCALLKPSLVGHAIAMTGSARPEDLRLAAEAGYRYSARKPVSFDALHKIVREALAG